MSRLFLLVVLGLVCALPPLKDGGPDHGVAFKLKDGKHSNIV